MTHWQQNWQTKSKKQPICWRHVNSSWRCIHGAGLWAANTPAGSSKQAAQAKPWNLPSLPLPVTAIKKPVFLAKTDFSEKRPDIGPFFWPDVGLSERRPDIGQFIWPILKTIGFSAIPPTENYELYHLKDWHHQALWQTMNWLPRT